MAEAENSKKDEAMRIILLHPFSLQLDLQTLCNNVVLHSSSTNSEI